MATGYNKLGKIRTSEILEELKKANGDNTEFFYLYVSTGGEEDEEQMDDHPTAPSSVGGAAVLSASEKTRKKAMNMVHTDILPQVLGPDGWSKVYDKDMKPTYRSLYFNIIKKVQGEDEKSYIQRVSTIRGRIAEEADKVKKKYHVNFKVNSLLSKPFLYDESALEESQ